MVTDRADTGGEEAIVEGALDTLLQDFPSPSTDFEDFLNAQFDAGLAWVHFPPGHGGLGVARHLQALVTGRLAEAGVPRRQRIDMLGYTLAGPTIRECGTAEQFERYLRPAFTTRERWCQLFSEPGAGSDLASLACRAVRKGDHWVVNGQKVWNSMADIADLGMLLTRTNPDVPKHAGITYFILDMHAPGVEVRPLRQMTGEAEFSEVFLTDVVIPDSSRLGEVDNGWSVAMRTLASERNTFGGRGATADALAPPIQMAVDLYHKLGITDPVLRSRLTDLWIRARLLTLTHQRGQAALLDGRPGPAGSITKIGFAEMQQQAYELCLEIMGDESMLYDTFDLERTPEQVKAGDDDPRRRFLRSRANSIEGGTVEIMRNIIAERLLGLPAGSRADKNRPWRDVPRGSAQA